MGFSFLPVYISFSIRVCYCCCCCCCCIELCAAAMNSSVAAMKQAGYCHIAIHIEKRKENECLSEITYTNKWKFERENGKNENEIFGEEYSNHTDFKCSIEEQLAESMRSVYRKWNETFVQFAIVLTCSAMPWSSRNNFFSWLLSTPKHSNTLLYAVWINALRLGSDEMNYWKYLCYLLFEFSSVQFGSVYFFPFFRRGDAIYFAFLFPIYNIRMFKSSSMFPFSAQVEAIIFFLSFAELLAHFTAKWYH